MRDRYSTFTLRPPAGFRHLRYKLPPDVTLEGAYDDFGRCVFNVPSSTGLIRCVDGEQLTVPKYFALQAAYERLGGVKQ